MLSLVLVVLSMSKVQTVGAFGRFYGVCGSASARVRISVQYPLVHV